MKRRKRLDIQALRAIAVVAVVIYHFWPNSLIGGFMGVDVFFVISGFLMTATLMRDAQAVITAKHKTKAAASFLVSFYARRIKRLIPAASIALLGTLGLVLLSGNLSLIQETARQITAAALFVQNWFLANSSVDYLANTDPTAVQHFWSLSLEEQFYMVWPLLLLGILLISSSLYIIYRKKYYASFAVVPVVLLIAAFFAFGYQLTQSQSSLAYFVTPARVWELLLGALLAFLPAIKNYDLRLLLPWIGFAMICYALYSWDGTNFPGWHALIPTIGTALIIYGGGLKNKSKWSFEYLFRHRPIQWLGDISYSLYLWHWPLIILLPVLLYIDIEKDTYAILVKFGILALSLISAHVSYRYIEQTTQHIKPKKRYIYISFFVVTALIAGSSYYIANRVESDMRSAVQDVYKTALDDSDACLGAKSVINNCEKSFGYVRERFSQIASNDKYYTLLQTNETCTQYDAKRAESGFDKFCVVGDLGSSREITLWGDSHAQHWMNALDKIGTENHTRVNVISTSSCFDLIQYKDRCDKRFESIQDSGVLERSEAIIVTAWHAKYVESKGNTIALALTVLSKLTENRNVYILEDTPMSGWSGGPECNVQRLSCKNKLADATDFINQDTTDIISLGLTTPNKIISVEDIFCDDSYCYSNIGGIQVYKDIHVGAKTSINSHLTGSFSYTAWPVLELKFKQAGIIQ